MPVLQNLKGDALGDPESWLFSGKSFDFIGRAIEVLHFRPKSTFHFEISVDSGQRVGVMFL